jgi:hypothetical protein
MRLAGFAVLVASMLAAAACRGSGRAEPQSAETPASGLDQSRGAGQAVRCRAPVLMTIHRDMSRSTGTTGTPTVTEPDLRALVDGVLLACGGELSLGEIGSNSFQPLERLLIAEPQRAPARPTLDENPFIRANQLEQFATAQRAWEAAHRERLVLARKNVDTFFTRVGPSLVRPRNQNATDIFGAIERGLLALSEPSKGWSVAPQKMMILATDGLHTTRRPPGKTPPGDVLLLIIGTPGVLNKFSPTVFEGTAAAIRHVQLLVTHEE